MVEVEDKLLHRNREFLKPSKNQPAIHTEPEEYPESKVSMSAVPGPGQVTETQAPVTSNDGATAATSSDLLSVKKVVSLGLDPEQGSGASMAPSDQPGGDRLVQVPRRKALVHILNH